MAKKLVFSDPVFCFLFYFCLFLFYFFSDPVLQSVSTVQHSEYESRLKGIVCNFFTQRFLDASHFMKTLQPQRKAQIIRNCG